MNGQTNSGSQTRKDILIALEEVDNEGFNFIVFQLNNLSKEAGGFRDKAGWRMIQRETAKYLENLGKE